MEDMDKEILPLLSLEAKPQVRCAAMQMVLGLTGTPEGLAFITNNTKCLEAIAQIARDDQPGIAKDAFFTLINLSTSEPTAWQILNLSNPDDLPQKLLRYVLTADSMYADIACSLLSNLSRSERCSRVFVELMVQEQDTIGFDKLVEAFCKDNFNPNNKLHYIGSFLSNLTQIPAARQYVLDKERCVVQRLLHTVVLVYCLCPQIPAARQYVLDKERCVVQRLLPYTEYRESEVRRGGIVGVLHNCCFESEYHDWLLGDMVDILPRLLLPLAGPEEFDDDDMERLPVDLQFLEPDKEREPDPDIRRMLVQAVYQLCSTKTCRRLIKEKNTYVIMRELFTWEKDPVTKLATENLIQLLIGDEPEPGMEDLRTVDVPANLEDKLDKALTLRQEEAEGERLELEAAGGVMETEGEGGQ